MGDVSCDIDVWTYSTLDPSSLLIFRGFVCRAPWSSPKRPPRLMTPSSSTAKTTSFTTSNPLLANIRAPHAPSSTFLYSSLFSLEGEGLMVMSIDNLPTEMAAEASKYFGDSLSSLIPKMVPLLSLPPPPTHPLTQFLPTLSLFLFSRSRPKNMRSSPLLSSGP